ncbi:hypothetical protein [Pseudonocardia xishanensis]|uniref:Uncharacterized protein n=1 Tax=Pseudonocardia xishanensis TaxID=630995 RepID=A0ABP8RZQ9_9PSEU
MSEHEIAQPTMRQLIDDGAAAALLNDHFPVPARYRDNWWHVPSEADPDAPFRPAVEEVASEFEAMHRRRRAADLAADSHGR